MTTFPKNTRRILRKKPKFLLKANEMPSIGNFTVTDKNIDLGSLGPDRYLKFDKYSHVVQERLMEYIDNLILTGEDWLPPGALEILNKKM